jgi:hypothetical protein
MNPKRSLIASRHVFHWFSFALLLFASGGPPAAEPDDHWVPFGDHAASGFTNEVHRLGIYNGQVIAAGEFFYVYHGPDPANREIAGCIARWDGVRWYPFGVGVEYEWPSIPGWRPWINDFVVFRGDLVVGGRFHLAGGRGPSYQAYNVARWDGSAWHRLGNGINYDVSSMAVLNDELFVGGNFTQAGGNSIPYIARWNGASWRSVGEGLDGPVYRMIEFQGKLIAAGGFTRSGSTPLNRIGQWDGSRWSAITPETMSYYSDGLAVFESTLVATMYWSPSTAYLSRWNGTTWSQFEGGTIGSAFALAGYNGRLVIGGNIPAYNNIAEARDGRWQAMGSGVDNDVLDLLEHEGTLYVAGRFLQAGGRTSHHIARYDDVTTPVGLQDFVAVSELGGVRLQWRLAASGHDELAGIRVQRADGDTEPYRTLTESPLFPEAEMSYFDADVVRGDRIAYRLMLDHHDGSHEIAGPIYVSVAAVGQRVSLRTPRDPVADSLLDRTGSQRCPARRLRRARQMDPRTGARPRFARRVFALLGSLDVGRRPRTPRRLRDSARCGRRRPRQETCASARLMTRFEPRLQQPATEPRE